MSARGKQILAIVLSAVFFAAWVFFLLFPFARTVEESGGSYTILRENGEREELTFAEAYERLVGGEENTLVFRSQTGEERAQASEEYAEAYAVLSRGGLANLAALSISEINPLERVALWRAFQSRVWYADGFWKLFEEGVKEAGSCTAEELVLLSGSISSSALKGCGAERLVLCADAEFTVKTLSGTAVKEIVCNAPYEGDGKLVYLNTVGGKRLVAAVPSAKNLTVEDYAFADEGALRFCRELEALSLPFAGSSEWGAGSAYAAEIAYLFSDGENTFVPETLKHIRVRGGSIGQTAFYRLSGLEEINLCGVEKIEKGAFENLPKLQRLHTPVPAALGENYNCRVLDCGCFEYEINSMGRTE